MRVTPVLVEVHKWRTSSVAANRNSKPSHRLRQPPSSEDRFPRSWIPSITSSPGENFEPEVFENGHSSMGLKYSYWRARTFAWRLLLCVITSSNASQTTQPNSAWPIVLFISYTGPRPVTPHQNGVDLGRTINKIHTERTTHFHPSWGRRVHQWPDVVLRLGVVKVGCGNLCTSGRPSLDRGKFGEPNPVTHVIISSGCLESSTLVSNPPGEMNRGRLKHIPRLRCSLS